LIIDTQAHHALVDGGYAERRASCESVAAKFAIPSMRHLTLETLEARRAELSESEYLRARHAVTEIKRVGDAVIALRASDFVALGKLINQSHISLRDDYTVSCLELDLAVDAAIAVGALGARMVGGGFGGSAIALIKADQIEAVKESVRTAYAERNLKAPRFFTSLPSAGAKASLNQN
jgi:galactokinase